MSSGILNPAAASAGVKLPFTALQNRVSASAVTDDLVQIIAKAPDSKHAVNLANAVAEEFVGTTSAQSSQLESGAELQANTQLGLLNKAIAIDNSMLKKAEASSNQSEAAQLTVNLNTLNQDQKLASNELLQLEADRSTPGSGAGILQAATYAVKPSVLRIPELGLIGLAGGLLVGICAAFAMGRRDRRLRQRDGIAKAAGAPVLASLTAVRHTKSDDLLELLDDFQPSVSDKANLRTLLDELDVQRHSARSEVSSQNGAAQVVAGSSNGSSAQNSSSAHSGAMDLSALVLAGDEKAVAAITKLPAFAANLGIPVALVVDGSNASTKRLSIACAARDPLDFGAPRPNLLTYASAPSKGPEGVSLTVTVEVVDPVTLDVSDWPSAPSVPGRRQGAILVVSSGFAMPEDLQVVALASEHRGQPLAGVVVADPERSDQTSGQQPPRRVMGPYGPRQLAALRNATR
jgi:capsular polysaccharide biosynthesis protein